MNEMMFSSLNLTRLTLPIPIIAKADTVAK